MQDRLHLRWFPRRTVRARLALLYGTIFFVSGALLLAAVYALVDRVPGDVGTVILDGGKTVAVASENEPPNDERRHTLPSGSALDLAPGVDPDQVRKLAAQQHAAQMHELLEQSSIALGAMGILSIVLGWILAGRILRPLRTVVATARRISSANLHERLALEGPADELKELGETLDSLFDRLEGAFEAQRQFVANASHELRTPLARQRTITQVTLADPDATVESLRAALDRSLAAGEQQERLIEALLALARGEAAAARWQRYDIAEQTRELIAGHFEPEPGGVRIATRLDPAIVEGDPHLLARLITNVLDNATRYNVVGGQVTIESGVEHGAAVLTVTNTGPVILQTEIARLFEPFQRNEGERTGHGTGLGLSIVRAVAELHGAAVIARPRAGGGLELRFIFPAVGVASSALPGSAPWSRAGDG